MTSTAVQQEYLKILCTGHRGNVTSLAATMGVDALKRVVLAAHVTVSGETLTVDAADISQALAKLGGEPVAGQRLDAAIVYESMTLATFLSLPE